MLYKEGGLSVKQIMCVMKLEKGVKHGHLSFLSKDIYNLFNKLCRKESENDAVNVLQFCKSLKDENPEFQYAFTIDKEGRLGHIFWVHAHCYDWFHRFGDVVFDTTYKVNSYGMLFGMFVGIDNHGRTILFACALIRNETRSIFLWLFKTFVSVMGKTPLKILTDQDQ